jgi:hypothetical protein
MTIKTITLMSPNDNNLSYKIQKQLPYEKLGKIGERKYITTFQSKAYVFDDPDFKGIIPTQVFEVNIEDNKTEYFCSYHLKIWYEQLNCAFSGKYDNVENDKCKYVLIINNIPTATLSNIRGMDNIVNTEYAILTDYQTNELCIYNTSDVTLDEFLKYTYILLFINTTRINITKNYPELLNKVLCYIYQSALSNQNKYYLHTCLSSNVPSRDMVNHYNYIYGDK